jgi:hypothetical protein
MYCYSKRPVYYSRKAWFLASKRPAADQSEWVELHPRLFYRRGQVGCSDGEDPIQLPVCLAGHLCRALPLFPFPVGRSTQHPLPSSQ